MESISVFVIIFPSVLMLMPFRGKSHLGRLTQTARFSGSQIILLAPSQAGPSVSFIDTFL